MEFLKGLFENGALTWDEFQSKVTENGFKVADLSKGNYVAKKKYEDEIAKLQLSVTDLNEQITSRDTDIATLKKSLEDGGKDNETKLTDLTNQLSKLQSEYDTAKTAYENKLNEQSYEFAVKEFAQDLKFTSTAARRDFINELNSAKLTMKDKAIIGANDFLKSYKESNADAFIVEKPNEPSQQPQSNKPTFVQPTPPTSAPDTNEFISAFNFAGVPNK